MIWGLGGEADVALRDPLVTDHKCRMLSSWYNGPPDLAWMDTPGHRTFVLQHKYEFAQHLICFAGGEDPTPIKTMYGATTGRAYFLSERWLADQYRLATQFSGVPTYVTLATEFQTYSTGLTSWTYFHALIDQVRAAAAIWHTVAPGSKVSLGFGGWQGADNATFINKFLPLHSRGGMDFVSMQSMSDVGYRDGPAQMLRMADALAVLKKPIMVAHWAPHTDYATRAYEVPIVTAPTFVAKLEAKKVFAVSVMDKRLWTRDDGTTDPALFDFVAKAVDR